MNIPSMISLKSDPLVKVVYHHTQSHCFHNNRQVSNIKRTLVDNKIVDHSDVVGAPPVGAAPTTSSFSTEHLASLDWAQTTARRDDKHKFGDLVRLML